MSKDNIAKVVKVDGAGGAMARRHNELVVGKFRLSLQAHRLFLYVLSQVKPEHDETTEYEFSVNEIATAIGIDRSSLYTSMVRVMDELAGAMVNLQAIDADGKAVKDQFMRVGLVKNRQQVRVTGDGQNRVVGSIAVSLYKELLPYVRDLKVRFTELELKYVFRLTSSYAQKLYDLLKAHAFKGRPWRVSREDLISRLAVEPGKFQLWGDFRRSVLEKSRDEINALTDLAFDIEYVNTGRTVSEVIFHLRKEGGDEVDLLPGTPKHVAFKGMLDLGLSAKVAEETLRTWWDNDPELVRWHLAEAKRKKASGKADNAAGWFLAGLKHDYRPQRSLFAVMREKAETERAAYKDKALQIGDEALQDTLKKLYVDLSSHEAEHRRDERKAP